MMSMPGLAWSWKWSRNGWVEDFADVSRVTQTKKGDASSIPFFVRRPLSELGLIFLVFLLLTQIMGLGMIFITRRIRASG